MRDDRKDRASACLLGDVDLLRALALAHIRAVVMADATAPITRSRFVTGRIPPVDAYADPERFISVLIEASERLAGHTTLFYQYDRHLLAISRNRDRLQDRFRFHLPATTLVEDLVDKVRFQVLAEQHDLPVPVGAVIGHLGGDEQLPASLVFPVIAKPSARDDRWSSIEGGAKAVLLESPADLRAHAGLWAAAGLTVLVQAHVPGAEQRIESYHAYVTGEGDALGEFTGRKVRTRPRAFGHTTSLEISDASDVMDLGRSVRQKLSLTGVMKMDFKRTPDGALRLLEINPRFNLWHHAGAVAGVNLPALAHADLLGLQPEPAPPARAGIRWSKRSDLFAAREAGIGIVSWFRWAAGCRAWSGIALDDPLPVVAALRARRLVGNRTSPGPTRAEHA